MGSFEDVQDVVDATEDPDNEAAFLVLELDVDYSANVAYRLARIYQNIIVDVVRLAVYSHSKGLAITLWPQMSCMFLVTFLRKFEAHAAIIWRVVGRLIEFFNRAE